MNTEVHDVLSTRFHVLDLLGHGVSKRVYHAYDVVLEREVAVGVCDHAAQATDMDRLLAEAHAMAHVSTHAGIVTILDVAELDDALCLVSEYMPGGDLQSRIDESEGEPLDMTFALRTFSSIVSALAFAHMRSIVHRDIKPANIIFDAEGQAHLTDFGLASRVEPGESLNDGTMSGTVLYMAPEQLYGTVSARSDLYSIGCVLYEMLTSRVPIEGTSPNRLFDEIARLEPEPPSRMNPRVPEALDQLCMTLLAKEPERRPRTARHVFDDFRSIHRSIHQSIHPAKPRPGLTTPGVGALAARGSDTLPLVGRLVELAEFDRLLASETSLFIALEGAAGMGKTRLLDEIAARAREGGITVLRAAAPERSGAPLRPLLDALSHARSDALSACIREIERMSEESLDAAVARLAIALAEWAERTPTLLVVDDAHWADGPSLRLLGQVRALLEARPGAARLIVLLAHRPLEADRRAHPLLLRWGQGRAGETVRIEPLADSAVYELARRLAGVDQSDPLCALVVESAAGNPLFVETLLGEIASHDDARDTVGPMSTDAELSMTLGAAVASLVERLDAETIALARLAACFGTELEAATLTAASDGDRRHVDATLVELAREGLLELSGERARFRHALIREALYEAIPTRERRRLHASIAQALLATRRTELDLVSAADHAALSFAFDEPEGVPTTTMIEAARVALRRSAWDSAIRFTEAVLDTIEHRPETDEVVRAELHHLAGCAYHQLADVDRAVNHLELATALARASDAPCLLAEALHVLIRMRTNFGRVRPGADPGTEELERLADALQTDQPRLAGRLMETISNSMYAAGRLDESVTWAERACEVARRTDDPNLLAHAGHALAFIRWERVEPLRSLDTFRETLLAADRADNVGMASRCQQRIPHALLMLGRLDELEDEVSAARAMTPPIHGTGELTMTLTAAATDALVRGAFGHAEELVDEGLELVRETGYVGAALALISQRACLQSLRGASTTALETLEGLLEPGAVFDQPRFLTRVVARLCRLVRALAGDPALHAELSQAIEHPPRKPLGLQRVAAYCATTEAAWYADAWPAARHCHEALAAANAAGLVLAPGWPFVVPRLLGCAAAMEGDGRGAEAHLQSALELCEQTGMRAEVGKVHLDLARLYAAGLVSAPPGAIEMHRLSALRILKERRLQPYVALAERLAEVPPTAGRDASRCVIPR